MRIINVMIDIILDLDRVVEEVGGVERGWSWVGTNNDDNSINNQYQYQKKGGGDDEIYLCISHTYTP